jgi:hypothetical protein
MVCRKYRHREIPRRRGNLLSLLASFATNPAAALNTGVAVGSLARTGYDVYNTVNKSKEAHKLSREIRERDPESYSNKIYDLINRIDAISTKKGSGFKLL